MTEAVVTPAAGEAPAATPAVATVALTTSVQTPAATPTPADPATPAAAPSAAKEATYEPTGDAGLDMALAFIGKQGFDREHPAVKAAEGGDFSILKAELAAKGVQGAAEFLALGEQSYARAQEKAKAASAATNAAVYKVVGGEESWKAIQTWASANATPEEKAEINAQLSAGGVAAKAAATYLANAYNKANNVSQEPAEVTNGAPGKPAANAELSASDYAKEVKALNNKLKGRLDGSPEYEALNARRLASKSRGF